MFVANLRTASRKSTVWFSLSCDASKISATKALDSRFIIYMEIVRYKTMMRLYIRFDPVIRGADT